MDCPAFYVNFGVNGISYTRAMVDSGCLCYGSMSNAFAKRLRLPRLPITPRDLEAVNVVTAGAITHVAYADTDVDGHKRKRAFFYVIPGQEEDVILGRPWMVAEQAVHNPARGEIFLGSCNLVVRERTNEAKTTLPATQLMASVFGAIVRRARRTRSHERPEPTQIFAASLADIEQALAPKKHSDPQKKLPKHYHDFLPLFDRRSADKLPPSRPGVDHEITLETDEAGKEKSPPWGPLYGMSREELILLRRTLTELLDKNFIRASSSSAAAPVLFVKKPGGGLRFCVDYRGLNAITRKDRYPLPLIHETLRSLSKARWLTKLDVIAAFHKIRIKEGDEWKTAFRTRYGLFEYLVTPFGLTGAPATFQRYINGTLQEFLDEFVSAYLDDVLIYSSGSLKDHRKKVRMVMKKLLDAGLQIDIDKCAFETQSVKYLGFIVEAGKGIRVDPEKIRAIEEWERPRTVKGVRGFIGFANYYREFVPNFSETARPLTALTKKGVPFIWTNQCEEAFRRLKTLLICAPVLAQWDPDRKTVVETDSSGYAIGGALSQYDDEGVLRPVAFFSKKNNAAECNYPIHDKELLAVIRCLEQWDAELRSVPSFEIWTDHKNLEYFQKKRQLSERQVRWAQALARYNFTLSYRPGKEAVVPDALSRREQDMPVDGLDERLAGRYFQLLRSSHGRVTVHKAQVRALVAAAGLPEEDNLYRRKSTKVLAGFVKAGDQDGEDDEAANKEDPPENPFSDEPLKSLWEQGLAVNNRYWLIRQMVMDGARQLPPQWGLPISLSECSIDGGKRLCWRERIWIPFYEPLRTRLVQDIHGSILAGHPGRDLTKSLIGRQYTWPGLGQDVRKFARNCNVCGRTAVWREKKRGLLKPLPIPERMWSELSIDFITDLPPSGPSRATFIMVITDRLLKSVILEPMATITTEAVAQRLVWCLFRHHGIPRAIVSDRGPQFVSLMWKRVCELLRITRRLSTAYHPETDGSTERANQVIEHFLRCFTAYWQDDWADLTPMAMLAINNRDATSTGISPFFATHGYHVDLAGAVEETDQPLRTLGESPVAKAEAFVARLKETTEFAQAAIAAAQERQEEYANRARQVAEQFRVGDKVWLRLRNVKTDRPSRKLDWPNAKYEVVDLIGSHACKLNTPPGIHPVFHVSLLKRAADDPLPSQQQDDTQPPAIIAEDTGEQEWFVEEILQARKKGRSFQVLVKWVGYVKPTWEPLSAFEETEALDRFEAAYGEVRSLGLSEEEAHDAEEAPYDANAAAGAAARGFRRTRRAGGRGGG